MRIPICLPALLVSLTASSALGAPSPADCIAIEPDLERLRCYDAAHGRTRPAADPPRPPLVDRPGARPPGERSIWEQRILDDAGRRTFTLTTYRPSYLLLTHARPPAPGPGPGPLRHEEVKLHISLHTKVAEDLFPDNGDLWIAYG